MSVPFRNVEIEERIEKKIRNTQHPHGSLYTVSFNLFKYGVFISPYSFVCFHMHASCTDTDLHIYVCIYFCKLDYSVFFKTLFRP